jgi:hypothetical protein
MCDLENLVNEEGLTHWEAVALNERKHGIFVTLKEHEILEQRTREGDIVRSRCDSREKGVQLLFGDHENRRQNHL